MCKNGQHGMPKRQRYGRGKPADTDTDSHMMDLIGIPIHMSDATLLYPSIKAERVCRYEQTTLNELMTSKHTADVVHSNRDTTDTTDRMVMIVPAAVVFLTVVLTTPQSCLVDTYLQYEDCVRLDAPPRLHMAGIVLQSMRMPAEYVAHAILYYDKSHTLVLGFFDMRSCGSVALHDAPPLQRHMLMRQEIPEQDLHMRDRRLLIRHLWVGQETACLQCLQNPQNIPNLSFVVKCIGVLPVNICTDAFQRMLIPVNIPATQL